MQWQGTIDFAKGILLNGKPHGVERATTLPSWVALDEGRVFYAEDTGKLWVGTSSVWSELTPGGIGSHDHDDIYYTETELQTSGTAIVHWDNISNEPSFALPGDITYETLLANGDIGTGNSQVSLGSHQHLASTVTYNNGGSGLAATDVQAAIDEIGSEYSVGLDNIVYVAKNGDDTVTGVTIGTIANPFLTVQAAITSITDATSNKYYMVYVMPGTYDENLALKDYVGVVGISKEGTRIRDNTSGSHLWTTTGGRIFFKNIGLGGATQTLTYTHTATSPGGVSIWMDNCQIGVMTANCLGGGIDYVQIRNDCAFSGAVSIHSAAFTAYNSVFYGGLTINSDGFENGNQDSYGSVSSNTVKDCMGGNLTLQNAITVNQFAGGNNNDVWVEFYNNYSWATLTSDGNTNVFVDAQSAPDTPAQMVSVNGGTFGLTDNAFAVGYNNTTTSMTATETQAAIDEVHVLATADPVLPATSGAPVDTPANGTMRFDMTTSILYVYNGAAWKSTTLT